MHAVVHSYCATMFFAYYLTLAFLVAATNAAVLQKEGLENVLDVGTDYTKLEEEGDTMQIEEDYLEVEEESTLSEHKKTENRLGMDEDFAAESCREIYDKNFDSRNRSGHYWIKSAEGNIKVHIYNISNCTLARYILDVTCHLLIMLTCMVMGCA